MIEVKPVAAIVDAFDPFLDSGNGARRDDIVFLDARGCGAFEDLLERYDGKVKTYLYDQPTIDALQARIKELEKDAERYRWLRHGDNDELIIRRGPVALDYVYLPRNEKLDEVIDAAIAKENSNA